MSLFKKKVPKTHTVIDDALASFVEVLLKTISDSDINQWDYCYSSYTHKPTGVGFYVGCSADNYVTVDTGSNSLRVSAKDAKRIIKAMQYLKDLRDLKALQVKEWKLREYNMTRVLESKGM